MKRVQSYKSVKAFRQFTFIKSYVWWWPWN